MLVMELFSLNKAIYLSLEKLPSSSKLEISYIILPVVERIIDTKFHELVLELFGTTLVEVDDVF